MSAANVVPLRAGADDAPFDQPVPPEKDPPGGRRKGGGGGQAGEGEGPRFGTVVPLGVRSRKGATCYVFLDAAGLETMLSARDMHAAAIIEGLFGGRPAHRFLEQRWPHFIPARDQNGKPQRDDDGKMVMIPAGWSARECGADLIAACTKIGAADDAELRRDGVWSDGKGGLVVHCGRVVFAGDKEHASGFTQGKVIYIAAPKRDLPAEEEASVADCRAMENDLRLWTFAEGLGIAGPQLLMGMIACGILSAALDWRPHMAASGPAGAGKSSLARFMANACGVEEPAEDVSEPGVRRLFNARSGLIPLDENEASSAHMGAVLNLMRGASDGGGAKVVRASGEGSGADTFRIAGCFFLSAINPPHLSLADASRITLILLRRGPDGVDRKDAVLKACARARALYPSVLTRLVKRFGQYRANFSVFRGAAVRARATSRSADQVAALLAGWATLTQDEVFSEGEAAEQVGALGDFTTNAEQAEEEDVGRQVLRQLLGSLVPVDREKMTVAQAVTDAVAAIRDWSAHRGADGDFARDEARKRWERRLGALGLRYHETPCPGVLVANGAPLIEAAFAGTPWTGKAWQRPLRELSGAVEPKGPVKFRGNAAARAVHLPLELFGWSADDG